SSRRCSSGSPACSTAVTARSPASPTGRRATAASSTRCSTGRPTPCCSPAPPSTWPAARPSRTWSARRTPSWPSRWPTWRSPVTCSSATRRRRPRSTCTTPTRARWWAAATGATCAWRSSPSGPCSPRSTRCGWRSRWRRASWWVLGPGRPFEGVRAVALDFDGTVADSMGFLTDLAVQLLVDELGFEREVALARYRATSGADFRSQLEELAPGDPRCAAVARRFEEAKAQWMGRCQPFDDVPGALRRLAATGVPVLVCSSTRAELVRAFCERHGLEPYLTTVDGWAPERDKRTQLASWIRAQGLQGDEVVFVGDSRRDADVARAAGARFVGVTRPDQPDLLAGSGAPVVASLLELAAAVERARRSPVRLTGEA